LGIQLAINEKTGGGGWYYYFSTRLWEFLAGSILAYFDIFGTKNKNKILNHLLPIIGLLLISYSILFYTSDQPSYTNNFLAVIGTCLIIRFSNKKETIYKILSHKLIVAVGLISYSLYLWHYPIFSFLRITGFLQKNIFTILFTAFIIFILSICTYFFVEKPFKKNLKIFKLKYIFFLFFFIFFLNFTVILKEGFLNRVPKIISKEPTEKSFNLLKDSNKNICFNKIDGCKFNISSNKKIYLIGDSMMGTLAYDLKKKVLEGNYQFITYLIGNCIFFPGFNLVDFKNIEDAKCNDNYFSKIKLELSRQNNQIIIFGGRWTLYFLGEKFDNKEGGREGTVWLKKYIKKSNSRYETKLDSFINELLEISKNNKIILIYPIPEFGWDIKKKIWLERNSKKNFSELTSVSYEVFLERNNITFKLLDSIKNENIYRIYPHLLFCNTIIKNRCTSNSDKDLFYIDSVHNSLAGSVMINNEIANVISLLEKHKKQNF
jgi:hypothetical protein